MSESLKEHYRANTQTAPKGWESSITWNGTEGEICTGPLDQEPDPSLWRVLIEDWGLDPNLTEVVDGTVQVRAWDANVGGGDIRRLKYYKATLRPRQSAQDRADVDELCKLVMRRKPLGETKTLDVERSFVILLSDWQTGKGEGGGTEATIERILSALQKAKARVRELIRLGRGPQAIYIVGLGDLIENCDGWYPTQAFQTDLDRRSQKRVVRRLLLAFIDEMLPFKLPIVLGAVPGNHGENRRKGKAYTTWTDNDDLAVFEEVAEILAVNPERYGSVVVPNGAIADDLTMTLDISGIPVGFAHGHQMHTGVGAQAKVEKWWAGQALGYQPVASAHILFTGHLHHFVISEASGRTMMQCPAMDGGSYWFTATTGNSSPAGMLTLQIGKAYGARGWGDLGIL